MLDRYRLHQFAPAAPEVRTMTGADEGTARQHAPVAPAAPLETTSAHADAILQVVAEAKGIDWLAARSEMIPGDAEAGAAQLAADIGDGVELASVHCWLQLLEARALQFGWAARSPAVVRAFA